MKIKRTTQFIKEYCDVLTELKSDYTIRHSQYTTKIIHNRGKVTYSMNNMSRNCFAAANKVKKDVKNSDLFQEIRDQKFELVNYDYNRKTRMFMSKSVYNIDISSAYAYALLTHNLITSETFEYLRKLPKGDRLVAVGMLARSYVEYEYDYSGKIKNVNFFQEETKNAFFFLISEIDAVMKECAFYLGNHFLFYWVDGIFFTEQASQKTIKKVEEILQYYGYPYKWEKVENFTYRLSDDDKNIRVNCIKNGQPKEYLWGREKNSENILTYLKEKHKYGKSFQ
jgi:hypothetical protein